MKKLLIIVAAIGLFAANVVAQKSSDIGAFVGTAYYNGDVNPTKIFYKPGIAYGGIYRYNPNKFLALRFTATVLKVSGNDLDFNNEFQQLRNYNFSENIYDLSVLVDFNFFQYNPAVAKTRITTYTVFGASMVIAPKPTTTMSNIGIPMGLGVKFNLSKGLSGGIEWQYRKTFTDMIDNLDDETPLTNTHLRDEKLNYAYATKNYDWYSYCGAYIMIQLFRNNYSCKAYEFHGKTKY